MTVSGSTGFIQNLQQISLDAMVLLGRYNYNDPVNQADYTLCSNMLNKMIKGWEATGIHLWKASEGALFLTVGQQVYGMASVDMDIAGDSPVYNNLIAAGAGNQIKITTTTGITVNDNIGIQLNNNTLFWTTVTNISTDKITLSLAGNLPSAASTGNSVFSFTNRVDRPLMLLNARYYVSNGYERPLWVKGRTEFMSQPNKTMQGQASIYFYAPQVSDAKLYLWPTAYTCGDCIKFSYIQRIDDFVNSTDTPDLPQEWLDCITYNLALRIAPAFGIALSKIQPDVVNLAKELLLQLALWDAEDSSLFINLKQVD